MSWKTFCTSLRRTRLEVMGAQGKNASPLACPSRVPRSFLRRYFQAPATQASASDRVIALNLEREYKKKEGWRVRGRGKRFSFLPSPSPFIPLFCCHPKFRDELARKCLLCKLVFYLNLCGTLPGEEGGHSIIWPWLVCAAEQGMVFRVLSLKLGI